MHSKSDTATIHDGDTPADVDKAQPRPAAESKHPGSKKKKHCRCGKKSLKGLGVDKWPHGDSSGKITTKAVCNQ
ncbi:hypothetical protein BT96DRAFT_1006654 [Gymnopus androsaceus JB14]|uniref:Uncharacterized protein n=1 Tax=Gymnopus androsaceus JB14 TaxID=1447944 RepID=A0A6A4GKH7_9AGAR|nr:hypothetical protein BT96DRAFT_1006654 [Gymnopus androsaceus JB14]